MTKLDDAIYQLQREANEWEWLSQSTKDDEDNGLKCKFSEGSIEYKRRADEVNQVIEYLKELKTIRKAYELICDSYVNDAEDCNCPREVRENCKAQDYMARHCSLNSISDVKEYFLMKAGEDNDRR